MRNKITKCMIKNVHQVNNPSTYTVTSHGQQFWPDGIMEAYRICEREQQYWAGTGDASIYNRVTGAIYRIGCLGSITRINGSK